MSKYNSKTIPMNLAIDHRANHLSDSGKLSMNNYQHNVVSHTYIPFGVLDVNCLSK